MDERLQFPKLSDDFVRTLEQHAKQIQQVNASLAAQADELAKVAAQAQQFNRQLESIAKAAGAFELRDRRFEAEVSRATSAALRQWGKIDHDGVLRLSANIEPAISDNLQRTIERLRVTLPESLAARALAESRHWRHALASARRSLDLSTTQADVLAGRLQLDNTTVLALSRLAESLALDQSLHAGRTIPESLKHVIEDSRGGMPGVEAQPPAAGSRTEPSDKLREIEAWYANQPPATRLLILLLLYLLDQIFGPIIGEEVRGRWLKSSDSATQQIIINEIHQYNIPDAANSLRCVNGSGVNVREAPSTDAAIIGKLPGGRPVVVLESHAAFSKVEYIDASSGETRNGWAASGYLVKAVCRPKE